jgi:ring-1,2-phenylacetyl-CoA epoxidase subunit PaaE
MAIHFRPLTIARVTPDAAGSAAFTLAVPNELREAYDFQPGQFLTLRAAIDGRETRRSYSICSPHRRYLAGGEIDIGIKGVEDGVFSRWALAHLRPGMTVEALPPDGRFTPRLPGARHRVGFAAGSGITPILSIMASTLDSEPQSSFTLVYGNQRVNTIMFNETLQDLKDAHPARLSLIHLLSRQPQEVELLNGRIDEAKVAQLLGTLLPAESIDEAFLCGPEDMIDAAQRALLVAGVAQDRIHCERFIPVGKSEPLRDPLRRESKPTARQSAQQTGKLYRLEVVLDGKTHQLMMGDQDKVLDIALAAGLDLPYSCRGGVCCTCRARVLKGQVEMEKNFTLEQREIDQGFVLTCQARPLSDHLLVSFDDR